MDARRWSRARRGAAIAAALLLASCKTPSFLCIAPSGLKQLAIQTDRNSNNGLATRIDLLFVTDKPALKTIAALKARDYFAQKDQLLKDFPKAVQLKEMGLEPTQYLEPALKKKGGKAVAAVYDLDPPCNLAGTLLFVDYDNDAANRVVLTKAKAGTLVLGADDFTWRRR